MLRLALVRVQDQHVTQCLFGAGPINAFLQEHVAENDPRPEIIGRLGQGLGQLSSSLLALGFQNLLDAAKFHRYVRANPGETDFTYSIFVTRQAFFVV